MEVLLAVFLTYEQYVLAFAVGGEVACGCESVKQRVAFGVDLDCARPGHFAKYVDLEVDELYFHIRVFYGLAYLFGDYRGYLCGGESSYVQCAETREVDVAGFVDEVCYLLLLRGGADVATYGGIDRGQVELGSGFGHE